MKISKPCKKANKSLKIMSLMKNLPTQLKTEEENQTGDQLIKNLLTNEKDWGEKPKNHKM